MNRAERRRGTAPTRAQLETQAKRRRTILFASLGLVVVLAVVAVGYASRVPKTASDAPINAQLNVGQRAPAFAVSTTSGPFDLNNAGGKPTLLEVFASWCPHCQRETKSLDSLYDRYRDKINLVAVSGSPYGMDGQSPESQADVVDFITKFGARYPIAYDGELDVAKKYLQGGFPTLVLIGANGAVQAIGSGEIPQTQLDKAIVATLASKAVDPKFGMKS